MFGSILLIAAYILIVCEFIWYFTCTEHEDVPLIAMIVLFLLGLIPGLNVIMFFVNIAVFLMMNTRLSSKRPALNTFIL